MTKKQIENYNRMLATLKRIAKDYKTPDQIRRSQETPFDFDEELEMVYENIQSDAAFACKGVKFIQTENEKQIQQS